MRKITLIQGEKYAGKSQFIHQKFEEIKPSTETIEIINGDDWNTVIFIVKDKISNEVTILNSGSDTRYIIRQFGTILRKYPTASIFTAIRPYDKNPRLHQWMMDELHITQNDEVITIDLGKPEH